MDCSLKDCAHCLHKDLYTGIRRSFILNKQNLETTWMFISRGIDKWTVVYPYNGLVLSNKEQKLWYTQEHEWHTKHSVEQKSEPKEFILYDSIYVNS